MSLRSVKIHQYVPKPVPAAKKNKSDIPEEIGPEVSTPDLWEAMSCLSGDDEEVVSNDVGMVSWDRMGVLMRTAEYCAKGGL